MQPRWFTPESALEALTSLREPAEAIAAAWRRLDAARPRPFLADAPVDPRYFALCRALRGAVDRLAREGARVGGHGSIEFPARRGGRPVVLCWTPGEPKPATWRACDDAGGAPRPLDEGPWDPCP